MDELERNDRSVLFIVEVEHGRPARLILHPTTISDFQARLARGQDADEILAMMRRLSDQLGTPVSVARGRGLIRMSAGPLPRQ